MSISYSLEVETQLQSAEILALLFPEAKIDRIEGGRIDGRTDTGFYLVIRTLKFPDIDFLSYLYGINPTMRISLTLSLANDTVTQGKQAVTAALDWIKHERSNACLLNETEPVLIFKDEKLIVSSDGDLWTETTRQLIDVPHVVEEILIDPNRLD